VEDDRADTLTIFRLRCVADRPGDETIQVIDRNDPRKDPHDGGRLAQRSRFWGE
jgi:hypothetical protein